MLENDFLILENISKIRKWFVILENSCYFLIIVNEYIIFENSFSNIRNSFYNIRKHQLF